MKDAKIARLELSVEEEQKFQTDIEEILGWAKQLEEIKEVKESKTQKKGVLREDIARSCDSIFPFQATFIRTKRIL